jgi:hypothetical protein
MPCLLRSATVRYSRRKKRRKRPVIYGCSTGRERERESVIFFRK